MVRRLREFTKTPNAHACESVGVHFTAEREIWRFICAVWGLEPQKGVTIYRKGKSCERSEIKGRMKSFPQKARKGVEILCEIANFAQKRETIWRNK